MRRVGPNDAPGGRSAEKAAGRGVWRCTPGAAARVSRTGPIALPLSSLRCASSGWLRARPASGVVTGRHANAVMRRSSPPARPVVAPLFGGPPGAGAGRRARPSAPLSTSCTAYTSSGMADRATSAIKLLSSYLVWAPVASQERMPGRLKNAPSLRCTGGRVQGRCALILGGRRDEDARLGARGRHAHNAATRGTAVSGARSSRLQQPRPADRAR